MQQKRFEVLDGLPAYGPMYIPVAEDGEPFYSEGFVVRFYKADGTTWVANFKPGWTHLNGVFELDDFAKLLIIAGGTCYIMTPEHNQPILVFGGAYENALKTQDNRLILHDLCQLTIVESNGEYWDSETISWDGIKDVQIEGTIVKGFAYDLIHDADEWIAFEYDLNTKTLIGGSYNRKKQKPWWKFW